MSLSISTTSCLSSLLNNPSPSIQRISNTTTTRNPRRIFLDLSRENNHSILHFPTRFSVAIASPETAPFVEDVEEGGVEGSESGTDISEDGVVEDVEALATLSRVKSKDKKIKKNVVEDGEENRFKLRNGREVFEFFYCEIFCVG